MIGNTQWLKQRLMGGQLYALQSTIIKRNGLRAYKDFRVI